jgi:hypothetical protein
MHRRDPLSHSHLHVGDWLWQSINAHVRQLICNRLETFIPVFKYIYEPSSRELEAKSLTSLLSLLLATSRHTLQCCRMSHVFYIGVK